MIDVMLLIRVVVNNAIVLVEYIEIGRRQQQLAMCDAIIEAGAVRFRPILMTTLFVMPCLYLVVNSFSESLTRFLTVNE